MIKMAHLNDYGEAEYTDEIPLRIDTRQVPLDHSKIKNKEKESAISKKKIPNIFINIFNTK